MSCESVPLIPICSWISEADPLWACRVGRGKLVQQRCGCTGSRSGSGGGLDNEVAGNLSPLVAARVVRLPFGDRVRFGVASMSSTRRGPRGSVLMARARGARCCVAVGRCGVRIWVHGRVVTRTECAVRQSR
jgi:hypothetical protein